jgi:uncharacterized protein (TIGR01777 family)
LNILLTGSAGLIGSELGSFLIKNKHRVLRLVRRAPAGPDEVEWDPYSETLNLQALEGIDAVVHLAGESIASGRWTAEKKHRIRESRVKGTRLLAQSLASLFDPPKVLVSVSAIGYYGDRSEEHLNEKSGAGNGFLPELCREWETATSPAANRGIRVVIPRIGVVLSAAGGALALMLPIFRLGIGGRIGSGRQYMSWITIDDLVGIIDHVIRFESIQGPVNAVSPNPVTNLVFSKTLGQVLSRPVLFALPAFAARLAFGQMANEALLASARVSPARLIESGYQFAFPELEGALCRILQKPKAQN